MSPATPTTTTSTTATTATCRELYNYKHPHPCTPGVDCEFVVRWRPSAEGEGEWVEFEVTADLSGLGDEDGSYSLVWLALGFSSNPNMVRHDCLW